MSDKLGRNGLCLSVMFLWLAGCASRPLPPQKPVFVDPQQPPRVETEKKNSGVGYRKEAEALPPLAEKWLQRAERARIEQNYQQAEREVAKALRIAPQSAEPYLVMAEIKQSQGQIAQAKQLALKAKSLAGSHREWLARISLILQQ